MSADLGGAPAAGLTRILEAVVHSPDVEASVAFNHRAFDLEVVDRGPAGVLLGVPGSSGGRVRMVPAREPGSEGLPAVWDLGPRLLGMYSRDVGVTVDRVTAAGGRARGPVAYAYGPAEMREVLVQAPDGVWWTVPQVPQPPMTPQPSPALERNASRVHGELHTAVLVVANHDAAVRFFVDGGGMATVFNGEMSGETFERLVGIPAGAGMRLAFLVGPERAPARVEIMSFSGVDSVDRTREPLGLRRLVIGARDVRRTRQALLAAGGTALPAGVVSGPGGVEIELVEDAPDARRRPLKRGAPRS
jgi:catechol 2,3-dioxygenase-like lactoylglutathione lyase family enzyme